jgi:hypothetical protein
MSFFRELQRVRQERQELIRISKEKNRYQNADEWLSRLNHIAQIGILIAAVFGYFHTVVPLYEKAALDENLAKAQLELNSTQKKVRDTYIRLRTYVVRQLVFDIGAECTGLLIPSDAEDRLREGLDIAVVECFHNGFRSDADLKTINNADSSHLESELDRVGAEIDVLRHKAISEYEALPSVAQADPSVLPESSKRDLLMLEVRRRMGYSEEQLRRYQYSMRLDAARLTITSRYGEQARELVKGLNNLEWSSSP